MDSKTETLSVQIGSAVDAARAMPVNLPVVGPATIALWEQWLEAAKQLEAERDAARRQAEVLAEAMPRSCKRCPAKHVCEGDGRHVPGVCNAFLLKWSASQLQASGAEPKYDPDETPIPRTWEQVRADWVQASGTEPPVWRSHENGRPPLPTDTGQQPVTLEEDE